MRWRGVSMRWARCWVCLFEGGETFAEACRVFVGYGEDADAALGAAGFADEVVTATLVGVSNGRVYDLDQLLHVAILHCRRAVVRRRGDGAQADIGGGGGGVLTWISGSIAAWRGCSSQRDKERKMAIQTKKKSSEIRKSFPESGSLGAANPAGMMRAAKRPMKKNIRGNHAADLAGR